MKRQLILADGTTLDKCSAGYAEGTLCLYLQGIGLQDAAAIAFNPAKTQRIVFDYEVQQDVYEGFTNCVGLYIDSDGLVSVCLTKGADANVER